VTVTIIYTNTTFDQIDVTVAKKPPAAPPPPQPPASPPGPTETITVGTSKTLTRAKEIKSCATGDKSIVGVLCGASNDITLLGVKIGGPVTVTLVYTDATFDQLEVTVVS